MVREMVILQLLESHCVCILTYAIGVIIIDNRDVRRWLRVPYDSLLGKVSDYRDWDSVTEP